MAQVTSSPAISKEEYAKLRDKAGFNGQGFARFVGVNDKTERDWVSGEARVPGPVAALLWVLIANKIEAAEAAKLVARKREALD